MTGTPAPVYAMALAGKPAELSTVVPRAGGKKDWPAPMLHTLALPTLGTTELIIILVVVLIIFGPKNLPKLGRMMGRSIREFRSASSKAMGDEDDDDDAPRPVERNIEGQPKATPHAEQKGSERVSPGS